MDVRLSSRAGSWIISGSCTLNNTPTVPGDAGRRDNARRPITMWRTLLVDDNPSLREVLHVAADMDGRFDIIGHASNGERAVEAAQWLQPDLILLDVAMPVMDGLTAFPLLRRACPSAEIVLLTSTDAAELDLPAGVRYMSKNAVDILKMYDRLVDQLVGEDERLTG